MFNVRVVLHVVQQIQPKLVQPQIHDGDSAGHLLNIHHFFLQAAQLGLSVFQVRFLLIAQNVIVAGGGHIHNFHAGLHLGFQVNVLIQRHIRPEVDQLDACILAADAVNASKPLNDTNWVPMDVVIDKVVAVLEVLTFGNTVRCNQDVDIPVITGHEQVLVLGDGRKTGQHRVQVAP